MRRELSKVYDTSKRSCDTFGLSFHTLGSSLDKKERAMFKDNRKWEWFNEPKHEMRDDAVVITTASDTDFWQRTHYGFQRDNGHCLLTELKEEFCLVVRCNFSYISQYDQCGVMVRIDKDNWMKVSIENEDGVISRLGSVVTNLGYSDWSTQDISASVHSMWYRVQSKGADVLVEQSVDGEDWHQMRVAHLHAFKHSVKAGIYCCSPKEGGCTVTFDNIKISPSQWIEH